MSIYKKKCGRTSTISNSSFRHLSHVFTVGDIDTTEYLITTIEKKKENRHRKGAWFITYKGHYILQSSFLRAQLGVESIDFVHKVIALPVQKLLT